MSTENVTLLLLGGLLCCVNLLFGPVAAGGIAKVFARVSRKSQMPGKQRAEKRSLPGPSEIPPAMGDAQISKYR